MINYMSKLCILKSISIQQIKNINLRDQIQVKEALDLSQNQK